MTSAPRSRRRLTLLAALTVSLLAGSVLAVGGSLALFTSTPTLGGNAFTTGTVVLGLNPTTALLGTSCAVFDGASVYTGMLSAAAFGNLAQGAQAGDRMLNAAANETLCFQASLPVATGNAYQGAATTTTFTFSAEQTANNP
jgi:hypothetical protein